MAMTHWPETHWTRILHYDLFSGERETRAPPAIEASGTRGDAIARDVPRASRNNTGNAPSTSAERVPLTAADGYPLVGIHYPARGATLAQLVVAGAVGVPQRFYRRFAEFAAAHGFATTTVDYRGIGLSAPATLQGFRMDYFDWGRLDLAAAVAASASPGTPLYVVGHSFGGHTFGVLPNHRSVDGVLHVRDRRWLARLDGAARAAQGAGDVARAGTAADAPRLFRVEPPRHGRGPAAGLLSALAALVLLSALLLRRPFHAEPSPRL